jgi:hypothetical protein
MALDSTFREKFRSDALAAKALGQKDAWGIAIGAAMSAGLPMFIQGTSPLWVQVFADW